MPLMNNKMNSAARKMHHVLSNGAATITGPHRPRILRQIIVGCNGNNGTNTNNVTSAAASANNIQNSPTSVTRCYVCDDFLGTNQNQNLLTEMKTSHTSTTFPVKISQLVGPDFMVFASVEDIVCARCTNLINYLDRLENDVERVRVNLKNLLNKKYNLNVESEAVLPPTKLQKLNNGAAISGDAQQFKTFPHHSTTTAQHPPGTQVVQRKTTIKMYKCLDNTCAMCHINFANGMAFQRHMDLNHSTNVVVTLAPTAVPQVDTIATRPPNCGAANSPVYTCIHCQLKSTNKLSFDEHMRKHAAGIRPFPFKCKLCAQWFETRETAAAHARQHQGNVFKCGTCSMSFSKRVLLINHFEKHQQDNRVHQQWKPQQNVNQHNRHAVPAKQHVAMPVSSPNTLNSQKLSLGGINGSTSLLASSADDIGSCTTANNICFFSCYICSRTFIQENYYKQHMETHHACETNLKKGSNPEAGIPHLNSANLLSEASRFEENELKIQQQQTSGTINDTTATISDADIEGIFEKMHSDKDEPTVEPTTLTKAGGGGGGPNDQVVITTQADSDGVITFNITLPARESGVTIGADDQHTLDPQQTIPITSLPVSVSMDMPMLDQADETMHAAATTTSNVTTTAISKPEVDVKSSISGPLSMPSLDDDWDERNSAFAQTTTTTINTQSEVKNENSSKATGDDNNDEIETEKQFSKAPAELHSQEIISGGEVNADSATSQATDKNVTEDIASETSEKVTQEQQVTTAIAEAEQEQPASLELNATTLEAQIESGQIKLILNENGELLQLGSHIITDGDGNQILEQDADQIQQLLQTAGLFQMMADANGQMVLVQGDSNETKLMDASLVNADGQLVIQQSQDLEGSTHVISEDGTRIPVSVSYTEDGQPLVQLQQQILETPIGKCDAVVKECNGTEENEQAVATDQHIATTSANINSNDNLFALEDLTRSTINSPSASASTAAITLEGKQID
uniref:C2H2-type domain-containing protein n=1 Tax=Glossina austeni TaxID=7395 RepID=A0A1A9VU08_GLOAU